MYLLKKYSISSILDIGANSGQFSRDLRELGFYGKIYSFEPQTAVFNILKENSKKDKNWIVNNYAIGNFDGKSEINISKNTFSSSLLEMMPEHLLSAPQSKYIGKEEIEVKRLDTVFPEIITGTKENVFLKIDTQGFEKQVLEGAQESLKQVSGIHLEMSLVPLYKGDTSFENMNSYLNSLGYHLCSIEMEFDNPDTHKLLQIDGIYYKC